MAAIKLYTIYSIPRCSGLPGMTLMTTSYRGTSANEAHAEDCNTIVDALEERLANTPKPSEVLDWSSIW